MKPTGSTIQWVRERISQLGTDRLTAALIGLTFFLTATIAALCADLWLWPEGDSALSQPSAPQEPTPFALASWLADSTSTPLPLATPVIYPAAVRVRIPAIGIDRSIIEVPLTYDSQTNTWSQDYRQLFRDGREDLVGHHLGSASPGQPGNTVLVGHNYGYGVNGVFLRLGRLKAGQQVEVVNAAGQTFTYKVTEVTQIPWTTKDQQQLLSHQQYLSVGGAERLTLMTCGGSSWAPFPDRVYVVAYPVD
jgi:LPXTG-site transpeptidase (sortase) family protein